MRNERTLQKCMQMEIEEQPSSETTNRRKDGRIGRIVKRFRREHPPQKRIQ